MEDYETTRLLQGGFDYLICELRVLMPSVTRYMAIHRNYSTLDFFREDPLSFSGEPYSGKTAGAPRMSGVTHGGPRWDRNAKSGTTEHMIDGNGSRTTLQSVCSRTNGEPKMVNEGEMATLNCVDCLFAGILICNVRSGM